jgi:hypothetical protein
MNKQINKFLLFYSPLKIAAVDDNEDFLDLIKNYLYKSNLSTYLFPKDAFSKIDPIEVKINDFIVESAAGIYDLNFIKIKHFFDKCKKHHGILIADYKIPLINGIELLSKYLDTALIRVLLTGVYTIEEAVNALNNGVINYFLPKDDINCLCDVIKELEFKFFKKLTSDILKTIAKDDLRFINDEAYMQILNNVFNKYSVKGYCILNSYGAYLLETDAGNFVLNIYHKDNFPEISEWLPSEEKNVVLQGELIPSYFTDVNYNYKVCKPEIIGDYHFCIEGAK